MLDRGGIIRYPLHIIIKGVAIMGSQNLNMSQLCSETKASAWNKVISIADNECGVLVWDKSGNCRYYSFVSENIHFSVPGLNGAISNYSVPVTLFD